MEEEILGEIQVEIEEEQILEDKILERIIQEDQTQENQIPEGQIPEELPSTKKGQVHLEEKTGTIGTKETNQKMGFMAGVEILSKEKIDIKSQ